MSDQPSNLTGPEAIDKVKDLAKEHPDVARSTIDKVEDVVDSQTGGKFKDWVDKGGDLLVDLDPEGIRWDAPYAIANSGSG